MLRHSPRNLHVVAMPRVPTTRVALTVRGVLSVYSGWPCLTVFSLGRLICFLPHLHAFHGFQHAVLVYDIVVDPFRCTVATLFEAGGILKDVNCANGDGSGMHGFLQRFNASRGGGIAISASGTHPTWKKVSSFVRACIAMFLYVDCSLAPEACLRLLLASSGSSSTVFPRCGLDRRPPGLGTSGRPSSRYFVDLVNLIVSV